MCAETTPPSLLASERGDLTLDCPQLLNDFRVSGAVVRLGLPLDDVLNFVEHTGEELPEQE
eukprot:15286649-Heterocapsa_arctica.AAC.1